MKGGRGAAGGAPPEPRRGSAHIAKPPVPPGERRREAKGGRFARLGIRGGGLGCAPHPRPRVGGRQAGAGVLWGGSGEVFPSLVCVSPDGQPRKTSRSQAHTFTPHTAVGGKRTPENPVGSDFKRGTNKNRQRQRGIQERGGCGEGGSLPGGEKVAKGELEKCPAAARADAAPPYRCE